MLQTQFLKCKKQTKASERNRKSQQKIEDINNYSEKFKTKIPKNTITEIKSSMDGLKLN